jgi:hypothetical protein
MTGCKDDDFKVFAEGTQYLFGIGTHVDCGFCGLSNACSDGEPYIADSSGRVVAVD